jgi:hypothetical protein
MTQYIPVLTTTRKDCEALHKVYKKANNSLGKGSFGEPTGVDQREGVYEACITKDCGYVLKVITCDLKSGGKSLERVVQRSESLW